MVGKGGDSGWRLVRSILGEMWGAVQIQHLVALHCALEETLESGNRKSTGAQRVRGDQAQCLSAAEGRTSDGLT